MEKMATVLVKAGGVKPPQNLLLTNVLLWLCFGMTVRLCFVMSSALLGNEKHTFRMSPGPSSFGTSGRKHVLMRAGCDLAGGSSKHE